MSNLSILAKNELINHADFWKYCPAGKYDTFYGVSFVSSLKFVETYLLPRFANIHLVLGLSDNGSNPIGQYLAGLFDKRAERLNEVANLEPLEQRILDGTLTFRFTKKSDAIIHSKYYLMTNNDEYQAFIGSMNLTKYAVTKNYELLARFTGLTSEDRFDSLNQLWKSYQLASSEYIDAKRLKGLLGTSKKQTEINVYQDSVDQLTQKSTAANQKNVYVVSKDELKKLHELGNNDVRYNELSKQDKITIQQVIKLTGDAGALRQAKTLSHVGSEVYQVKQLVERVLDPRTKTEKTAGQLRSDVEMYPKPIMTFDEQLDSLRTGVTLNDQQPVPNDIQLSKEDVALFPQIVSEYQESKLDGEGHQTCDFLLWLFEAPWLWKVRQLYSYNKSTVKKREDVPIRAVLIGVGQTGKSTLASQLGSYLTRNIDNDWIDPSWPEWNSKNGSKRYALTNLNKFITGYLQSHEPVSTMIVDDIPTEYFTKDYFIRDLKATANNDEYYGPAPTVIYSTNLHDKSGSYTVSTDPAVLRRCYYFGFDSKFKQGYDQKINDLLKRANNRLYLVIQQRLKQWLIDEPMTAEREAKIEQDFLYPVKVVLGELLTDYGLFNDQLKRYFAQNYDFRKDRGKINWYNLVSSKTYQELITFNDDGKIANFPKKVFDDLSNRNSRDNGSLRMNEYFNYLPPKDEISARKSDAGFNVSVERFDKYIGHPVLQNLYEEKSGLKAEKRQVGLVTAVVKEVNKQEEQKQAKHRGLWGFFKRH